MWCFELLALPLWYGRTVCSFCGNYLFKKLESWGWCVVSDTQEREFLFLFFFILFWSSSARAVIFPVFPFFSFLWFFDGNITSKIKHKGFSFHSPTQHVIENVCLNLWTFFPQLSHQPHSSSSSCCCSSAALKFTLVYFFTIWLLYSGRVQSHSQVPH